MFGLPVSSPLVPRGTAKNVKVCSDVSKKLLRIFSGRLDMVQLGAGVTGKDECVV